MYEDRVPQGRLTLLWMILLSVGVIAVSIIAGVAFFSDQIDNATVAATSGCIQVTPTLAIDNQVGSLTAEMTSSAPCIPAQYVPVEFIHFDGQSYIDTGLNQLGNTVATVDYFLDTVPSSTLDSESSFVFGVQTLDQKNNFLLTAAAPQTSWRVDLGDTEGTPFASLDTARHTVKLDGASRTVVYDGNLVDTISGVGSTTGVPIYLGALN